LDGVPPVLEYEPRTKPARRAAGGHGGGVRAGGVSHGGGPGPRRDWPLAPALVVVALLAALLTLLGMYTQIQANLAGSQLPGA
jgi:hypothetical protein